MRIGIEAQHIFKNKKKSNDFVVLEFIRYLQEIDYENEYFIFVRPAIDRCLGETANFRIVDIPAAPSYIWEQIYLPEAALLEKCDVLHCTGIIAPVFSKVPIITTVHDIAMLERILFFEKRNTLPKKMDNVYIRYVLPKVIRKSKRIIAYSNIQRVKIAEYFKFDINKITIIEKGISNIFHKITDIDHISKIRKKYHLPERFIYIIGLSGSIKEIKTIVAAFTGITNDISNPIMLVLDAKLNTQVKLNAHFLTNPSKSLITVLKSPIKADLPAIYNMSDCVINISDKEEAAFGILEIMACETPVISIKSDTIVEITGKAIELTDISNPVMIIEAINRILHDTKYSHNLNQLAKNQVAQYTWQGMTGNIIKIYEQVVANRQ